jgi:hypothetical protein
MSPTIKMVPKKIGRFFIAIVAIGVGY